MIYAINFATEEYEKGRKFNTKTAYKYGVDRVIEYSLNDIEQSFYKKNIDIFREKRGCGYWLWKPYFIDYTLKICKDGDWVIYSDSSMIYRKDIKKYVGELESQKINMLSRVTKFKERQFTKRDVFIELRCDISEYTDTLQRTAGAIIIKNTEITRKVISEWLSLAENKHLITDEENIYGENYTEFIDHRHDQSLFSIICKKYSVSFNKDLYLDMAIPIKSRALLIYHNTKSDKYIIAYLKSVCRAIMILCSDIMRK